MIEVDIFIKAINSLVTAPKSFGFNDKQEIISWNSEAKQPTKEEIDAEIEKQSGALN